MGRNTLLALLMIGLSVPLYFSTNTMMTTFNYSGRNVNIGTTTNSDNWIFTVNTTVIKVNENCSILKLTSNVTFLEDVFIPQKIIGGVGFVMENSTGFFWTPYLYSPTLATEVNYHQAKGTTLTNYTITINKTVSKFKTDFVFNTNVTANYTLKIYINQDLKVLTGLLSINCDTGLNVSLNPGSWYATGHFDQYTPNQISTPTDNYALATTTSITKLEPNITKLTVVFNETYYETIKFSKYIVGIQFFISSNTTNLLEFLSPEITYKDFTINKSSISQSWDFIFYSKYINYTYYDGIDTVFVNVTKGGMYQFNFINNLQLPSYTGTLNISLAPLGIIINPASWHISGYLADTMSSNSKNTDSVGYNFVLPLAISFLVIIEVRKRKNKQ